MDDQREASDPLVTFFLGGTCYHFRRIILDLDPETESEALFDFIAFAVGVSDDVVTELGHRDLTEGVLAYTAHAKLLHEQRLDPEVDK